MTTLALLKLRVSIVISKQLNAAPYLRHKPWQLLREEPKGSCTYQPYSTRDFTYSSLAPQTNDCGLWFGNETTCAHAFNVRKWRPSNRQQAGRAENSFINQDEFVAIKTLSDCEAPRCDIISTSFVIKWRWELEPFSRYRCLTNSRFASYRKCNRNGHFLIFGVNANTS